LHGKRTVLQTLTDLGQITPYSKTRNFKMATKVQKLARAGLFKDLTEMQKIMSEMWVDDSLPPEWSCLEANFPSVPKRKKVTVYMEEDVWKWFRTFGRGTQDRINAVLRIYRNAVLTGDVKGFDSEYAQGPEQAYYLKEAQAQFEAKLQEMARDGRLTKEGIAAMGAGARGALDTASAKEEIFRRLEAMQRVADAGDGVEG
jgi:uncharacterized protein (DUF4415 family)